MEDLKEERSSLKRKVTVLASRLKRAVKKEMSSTSIRGIFAELEVVYLDFLATDDEYNQAIEEDDQLEGEYAEVNGLSLVDYTESVDTTYKEAQSAYNQHRKKKAKGKGTVTNSSDEESSEVQEEEDDASEVVEDNDSEGKSNHKSNLGGAPKVTQASAIGSKEDQTSTPQSYTPSPADLLFSTFYSQGASCMSQSSHLTSLQLPLHSSFTGNYQHVHQPFSSMSSGTVPVSFRSATTPGIMSSGMTPSYSSAPYFPYGMIPSNSGAVPGSAASNPMVQPPNTSMHVKVKAAELPRFSGLRKDWPQFRAIWPKLAIPAYPSKEMLACQLQICIKDTLAARMTDHISIIGPQSFDDIWNCLSDFYDDEAAAANEILKELSNLRSVKSEDYRSLVEHINKIEGYFTQLASLKEMGSLSMREVDNLASKLPESVKKEWHKRYQQLLPDEKHRPFHAYVKYLKEERKYIIRLAEQQPSTCRKQDVTSHNANMKTVRDETKFGKSKCAVHRSEGTMHSTENCRDFNQLDREEKLKVLREVNACFRCMGYHQRGKCHTMITCTKCGQGGHNTLLCLQSADEETGSNESLDLVPGPTTSDCPVVPTSSCNATSKISVPVTAHHRARGLYAIFSAPVVGSRKHCSVFTDPGSDRSYITNSAARKLRARKLSKYVLEVASTGGKDAEYESDEYELDIITKSGRVVTVRMFSLETITGELAQLDPSVLKVLFPEYDSNRLQRQSNEVDVLLGSDYFGLHPKEELCSVGDNLSLMSGALGVCVQGSHPDLNVDNSMDSNMMRVLKSANLKISTSSNCVVTSVKHPVFCLPSHPVSSQVHECPPVKHTYSAQESGESAPQVGGKCNPRVTQFPRKADTPSYHPRSFVGDQVDSVTKHEKVEYLSSGAERLLALLMGRSTVKNSGGSLIRDLPDL